MCNFDKYIKLRQSAIPGIPTADIARRRPRPPKMPCQTHGHLGDDEGIFRVDGSPQEMRTPLRDKLVERAAIAQRVRISVYLRNQVYDTNHVLGYGNIHSP